MQLRFEVVGRTLGPGSHWFVCHHEAAKRLAPDVYQFNDFMFEMSGEAGEECMEVGVCENRSSYLVKAHGYWVYAGFSMNPDWAMKGVNLQYLREMAKQYYHQWAEL